MEGFGAGLSDGRDTAAIIAAVLGLKVSQQDFDFADGFERRQQRGSLLVSGVDIRNAVRGDLE